VLCDFDLLDLLTKGGTVSGTVFTDNTDFSGSFTLEKEEAKRRKERRKENEKIVKKRAWKQNKETIGKTSKI
jgi:hypothetical protein